VGLSAVGIPSIRVVWETGEVATKLDLKRKMGLKKE
jgi:hypothetical protein